MHYELNTLPVAECYLFQIHVSEHCVAKSLSRVALIQDQQRQHSTQQLMNPIPYKVTAHGKKLHLDQNEKVVMYGMTHVVAVDGYSCKIVGFITLPVKNAIAIYNCLSRPLLLKEGYGSKYKLIMGMNLVLCLVFSRAWHVSVLDKTEFLSTDGFTRKSPSRMHLA